MKCYRPTCQQSPSRGEWFTENDLDGCPQCGLTRKHEKYGFAIQRLVIIHFDPPSEMPEVGMNYRACDHTKGVQAPDHAHGDRPNPYHIATGNANVVNCPKCKLTEEFRIAMEVLQDDDAPRHALEGSLGRIEKFRKPILVKGTA
jgi:hypothetical protein